MLLPEDFVFTQQNLQDYVDCEYRFYLRHIQKLEWPAIESEPVRAQEELMLLGTRFHLLCQQYFSGIPADVLSKQISNPDLAEWWRNFLTLGLDPQSGFQNVEKLVSMPFAGYRLAAKIDLLVRDASQNMTIYDWKTSRHQPKRQTLLERMQSKVYPLVISQAENARSLPLVSLEMIYWYPAFPTSPIRFTSTPQQRDQDQAQIESLVAEITSRPDKDFHKTDHEKACAFCRYRSLCNRGLVAGMEAEKEDLPDPDTAFDLDFDAI